MTRVATAIIALVAVLTLLGGGIYAFAERPTRDEVDRRIADKQAVIVEAVKTQTRSIHRVEKELQQLRDVLLQTVGEAVVRRRQ